MMKKSLFLLLTVYLNLAANAQSISPQVIASGGDFFANSSNSISWTLGETVVETFKVGNVILTQGFQQPFYHLTSIDESLSPHKNQIAVYPVPSTNLLNINFNNKIETPVIIELFDFHGRMVISKSVDFPLTSTELNLMPVLAGLYMLKISSLEPDGKVWINNFKIIKN